MQILGSKNYRHFLFMQKQPQNGNGHALEFMPKTCNQNISKLCFIKRFAQ